MGSANGVKGQAGESRAAAFLAENGLQLVGRNVRLPGGEIDLVCLDGTTLVFVEVKARSGTQYGAALAAVDAKKRRKLRSLAADYAQVVAPGRMLRFDIVAIDGNRIVYHRNAF